MIIGIDGSRAFLKQRTGIEEYSYQVIRHLTKAIPAEQQVILYLQQHQASRIDFKVPDNWRTKELWAPRFWTQMRLSLEMFFCRPDALFIPAHTVPLIHPKNTSVVIHGLEYEITPKSYSFWERLYMRLSIRFSVWAAKKIIAVSENTKKDLQKLYGVAPEKIKVIYEGFEATLLGNSSTQSRNKILFIGRLETRKNIIKLIEAFEILKKKYNLPHKLVLAGREGIGFEDIKNKIAHSPYQSATETPGFISEEQKKELLKEAAVFVFPSLYEGFGLPVLEAQAAGVPVITSNLASLPEVGGGGALYVNPADANDIAEKLHATLTLSESQREELTGKGYKNLERFSWQKCAKEIANILAKD